MEVIISIKNDLGETVEIAKELGVLDGEDIIGSVEREVSSIREGLLPILSEKLIESHQQGFEGKKNQEEERQR